MGNAFLHGQGSGFKSVIGTFTPASTVITYTLSGILTEPKIVIVACNSGPGKYITSVAYRKADGYLRIFYGNSSGTWLVSVPVCSYDSSAHTLTFGNGDSSAGLYFARTAYSYTLIY